MTSCPMERVLARGPDLARARFMLVRAGAALAEGKDAACSGAGERGD